MQDNINAGPAWTAWGAVAGRDRSDRLRHWPPAVPLGCLRSLSLRNLESSPRRADRCVALLGNVATGARGFDPTSQHTR